MVSGFGLTQKEEHYLIWDDNYNLTWNDFTGHPLSNSKFDAISICSINVHYKTFGDTLKIEIKSCFNTKKSWVKSNQKTDNLLLHEQGHFNLTEIYTRLIRKSILSTSFNRKNIEKRIAKMEDEFRMKCRKEQDLYDEETELSKNKLKQEEWSKSILKRLAELSDYKQTNISLIIG